MSGRGRKSFGGQGSRVKTLRRRNAVVLFGLLIVLGIMTTLVCYSVTIYRLFCAATGYFGTTEHVATDQNAVSAETIVVRFNTDVAPGLPWRFTPAQPQVTVHFGEQTLVYFRATNLSDRPIVGHATFNVAPDIAGRYFDKIQCFCFTEESLAPHQTADMPVLFFVDPAMLKDPDAGYLRTLTLSYTFFRSVRPQGAQDLSRYQQPMPATAEASPERGRQLFGTRCAVCHGLEHSNVGPMLGNVFDRPAGQAQGYVYSAALRGAKLVWSANNLDRWLENPQAFVPGASMPIHVADPSDRRDIISYLKSLNPPPENQAPPSGS
jgi:cytochrome c oxidase assembly protein subunit 11